MSSQGPNLAGTGASVDRASATAWTTPGNITADDASTASAAVPTDYLVASNFGFSIPSTATIVGVTVEVQAHETGTGSSNYVVQLHSNTTPTLIGNSKNSATVSGTTPTTQSFGGVSDLWGATLTPSTVNATGFGVSLWSTDTTNTLLVDFIQVTIEYTDVKVEDGDTWNDGVPQRSVAAPIAKAAATLAAVVGLALGLHSPMDELAAPPSIPGGSAASAAVQRAQVAPVTWQWSAGDEIVPQPAPAALDAGEWTPAPAALVRWVQQPWADADVLPVAVEESEWTPSWAPYRVTVRWWDDDGGYAPVVAPIIVDDEAWSRPLVSPGARWTSAWSADDELGTAPAPIAEDEGWDAPVVAAPARWVVVTWGQDEAVTAAPLTPAEVIGAGTQRAQQGLSILPQWGAGDEFVPSGAPASIVEDDAWLTAIVDAGGSRWIPLWSGQDAVPTLPVEDAYDWQAQWQRRLPVARVWADDEAPRFPSIVEDEPFAPRAYQRGAVVHVPWAEDEVVQAVAPLPVDEQYWWTGEPRLPRLAAAAPFADDGSLVVAAPGAIVEDEGWSVPIISAPSARWMPAWGADDAVPTAPVDEVYQWSGQWVAARPVPLLPLADEALPPVLLLDEEPWVEPFVVRARPQWIDGWMCDPVDVRYTLFSGSPGGDRIYHVLGGARILRVRDGARTLPVFPGDRDMELEA